jgi:hypothetical protein
LNPISEISLEGDAPSSPELRNFGSDILTCAGINLNLLGGELGGSWCLGEKGFANFARKGTLGAVGNEFDSIDEVLLLGLKICDCRF